MGLWMRGKQRKRRANRRNKTVTNACINRKLSFSSAMQQSRNGPAILADVERKQIIEERCATINGPANDELCVKLHWSHYECSNSRRKALLQSVSKLSILLLANAPGARLVVYSVFVLHEYKRKFAKGALKELLRQSTDFTRKVIRQLQKAGCRINRQSF